MALQTYRLDLRQGQVKLVGIEHKEARVLARNATNIVVAFAGWGENPGSRYSMLYSYYPAETKVYEILEVIENDYLRVEEVISWRTRPKK